MFQPVLTWLDRLRRRPLTLTVCLAAAAPVAALATAAPAMAERHPTGEFAPFVGCPLTVTACVVAETTGGSVAIGNETVPISQPITLQGGFNVNEATGKLEFFGAEHGETLSKTPQTVPRGTARSSGAYEALPAFLRSILNKLISEGITGVTATTELAAPATDIGLSTEDLLYGSRKVLRCRCLSRSSSATRSSATNATLARTPTRS